MQNITALVKMNKKWFDFDSSLVVEVYGHLDQQMRVDDWMSMILSNGQCVGMNLTNGYFNHKGYILDNTKVLKVVGLLYKYGYLHYLDEPIEEGILDLEHGTRFEGYVLKKTKIPCGFGCMYDDEGLLIYEGIMIDWKRFGYGVSYHNNGLVEYEGFWCDDKRFGRGKLYDRNGQLVKDCELWDGSECGSDEYIGDGSQPINIGIKHLKLKDKSVLSNWNVSWLSKLESIEIGDDCFDYLETFKIEGLNRLKRLKIGSNSFARSRFHGRQEDGRKSFHIVNCESLKSIEIGTYSFRSFGGKFELKNLQSLQSLNIGIIGADSHNFEDSSFVIRGNGMLWASHHQIFPSYKPSRWVITHFQDLFQLLSKV